MTPNLKYDLYVAHPVSTTGEFNDSIRLAKRIKEETKRVAEIYADGRTRFEQVYEVYAPALNKEINDKSNNPTPQMIYEQDMEQLDNADVVVVNYRFSERESPLRCDSTPFRDGMIVRSNTKCQF